VSRLVWNSAGIRFFESGIDRGVLYVGNNPGVAWAGLTSVTQKPTGGEPTPYYVDGVKYLNVPASEEFEATLTAYTYPDEFGVCDGSIHLRSGLFATQQPRRPFGLSYRTRIGNDLIGSDYGYKIHIVYNALAKPSSRSFKSLSDSVNVADFSWDLTTTPPSMPEVKSTAHLEIDSRFTNSATLAAIEDALYGTESTPPRLLTPQQLIDIFEANSVLEVTDHGDGTFTVTGPDNQVSMIDTTTWFITSDSITFLDADTYMISSL
jgi:hypothetical protein